MYFVFPSLLNVMVRLFCRRVGLRTLPPSVSRLSRKKKWEPRRLTTLRAFTACYKDSYGKIVTVRSGALSSTINILHLSK
jgi:hypothetical protein